MDFININPYIYYFLMDLVNYSSVPMNVENNRNVYGDGYGTKWIYFPDGDGFLHYVNLTITEDDMPDIRESKFDDIKYKLYIGNDTESYILLDGLGKAIDKSHQKLATDILFSNVSLKMITHGWRSSVDKYGVSNMKNAYLETQKVNVITVDWSITADSVLYNWVANETKAVGGNVAVFLNQINYLYNVTGTRIHLIGHSLGAHVMGIAASEAKMTVDRVTGLDPARPLFEFPLQDISSKLDSTDAKFVDVIHTCGGILGCEAPIGTADFYPNNGIAPQPGCDNILKFFEACSHGRSFNYFIESIKYPASFPAYQCQNWTTFLKNQCGQNVYMGESVDTGITGTYYLRTNSFEPFGIRKYSDIQN